MQCDTLKDEQTLSAAAREQYEGPDINLDLEPELSGPITLVLVEEDQLLATLLQDILTAEPDFELVASVGKVAEAQARVMQHQPSVLLLDLGNPDDLGIRMLETLAFHVEGSKILVLSGDERREIQLKLARAGAHGFLAKSSARDMLTSAIRRVAAGEVWFTRSVIGLIFNEYPTLARRARQQDGPLSLLSDREREVLVLLAKSLTNKQIADELFMSLSTVKSHIRSVFQKLELTSRTEAALFAVREGLLGTAGQND